MSERYLSYFDSMVGPLGIVEEKGFITEIFFKGKEDPKRLNTLSLEETELIKETKKQLAEYFHGKRKEFVLPLKTHGTEFQKAAWKALAEIPYGEVRSYKQQAEKVGSPKAYRAVGSANNKNPIAIVIPCHRVVGANGKLVGYGGGLDIKEKLLNLEKDNENR